MVLTIDRQLLSFELELLLSRLQATQVYRLSLVRCRNFPAPSGLGPAWLCETDLPLHLQFSTLEVVCEGYESKDDKYILDGSCGLEYSLKHTRVDFVEAASAPANFTPTWNQRTGITTLPAFNLEAAEIANAVASSLKIESQWSGYEWLILGSVIYICCYCLYHVVQEDLREALTVRYNRAL